MESCKRHGAWAHRLGIALVLITCLCVALVCLGCGDSKEDNSGIKGTGEKTTGKWVVELYMCGTDLESEGGAATNDLAELTENPPPEGVTFVIQTGGAKKWHNDAVKRKEIDRFVYDKDGLRRLDKLPDADMASPDTLASFLKFAQDKFEADHRILIMWDHGGGTVGGACYDERTQHMFGNDANVDVDWDKGTCKDNFDGTWMMLDKHPVYIDVTEQTEDHITYAIPIKLNGEQMNLFVVYEDAKQAYRMLM